MAFKPFDVEFPYIIHFETVEEHFNATFGEYQIYIMILGILVKEVAILPLEAK